MTLLTRAQARQAARTCGGTSLADTEAAQDHGMRWGKVEGGRLPRSENRGFAESC